MGQQPQDEEPEHADADLEQRVDLERVLPVRDVAGQPDAADAHPAHERREQHAQRDRGRADNQGQHLKPDDLVDERRTATRHEQENQPREEPIGR